MVHMMRVFQLARVCAGILLLASSAGASIHDPVSVPVAVQRAHELTESQLPRPLPANAHLFSNAMLDPARCNYEYVELYGTMIVRTELKLTCTTHH